MKKILFFAATAAFLAACSSDDLTLDNQPQQAQLEEGAVGFDVYTQKTSTRAGKNGSLTTTGLKTGDFATDGFGVFGYYTDNNDYEQRATPNFFYNQQVKWNNTADPKAWEYFPVKYWPNEYGSNAVSDDADKVTYFAYAPWVNIIPSSGKIEKLPAETDEAYKAREQWGITGMSKNTTQGDPLVKYIASFNTNKSVDLCWGVADNNDGVWPIVQNDAALNIANGTPWLNVQRPANVGQKVKFTFKHATAQMRINIDAIVNEVRPEVTPNLLDPKTRIWVREVKFKGFALKGTLNLNNDDNANKPYWLDYNGQNELVAEDVIVYDGRKDGKEGVNGAIATNEKTLGLNPALVQDGVYEGASWAGGGDASTPGNTVYNATALKVHGVHPDDATEANCYRPGVTTAPVNLFNNAAIVDEHKNENDAVVGGNSLFHVIPVDENFEVEIVYDVETVSENLAQNLSDGATKGSSIENRIRKTIAFGDEKKLKPGHSYTLNLHLGMNSVEFDAAVTDWIEEAAQPVDLPLNAPIFACPGGNTIIPYDAENYTFGISGLSGGESLTAAWSAYKSNNGSGSTDGTEFTGWDAFTAGTPSVANAGTNGLAIEKITTKVNPTTSNRTVTGTWTAGQSGKTAAINFTQLAHPIQISAGTNNEVTWTTATKTITLVSPVCATPGFGWMNAGLEKDCAVITPDNVNNINVNPNKCGITVKRNGVNLNWVVNESAIATTADSFLFGDAAGTITFRDDIQKGDVYEVTLKTGDAPAETISIKIVP